MNHVYGKEKSHSLRNMIFCLLGLLVLLASCQYSLETRFLADPGNDEGWWDINWTNRRVLTFDNSGQSENLMDFPVLVKLDSGRIDYGKTQNAGQDLRFIDVDGIELEYEIEEWNESGESFIWVKIPQIDGSSSADFIWMYYGNNAAPDIPDSVDVWDANYAGVWHLNENSGTLFDSTINSNDGTPEGTVTRISGGGAIGGAQEFDAGPDRLRMVMNTGATVTISAWAKLDIDGDMLWCLGTPTGGPDLWFNTGEIVLNTWNGNDNAFGVQPANVNQWHYYSTVISSTNTELYIDGITYSTAASYENPTESIFFVGSSSASYTWDGSVDEVRISNIERSADWNKAQYDSMTDVFVIYGVEE